MKIGSIPDAAAIADATLRSGRATQRAIRAKGEELALSAAGTQIGGLGTQEYDSRKVEAIRQAIREGRFSVNAAAIADRLIADAAALLAPRTRS